ncbi:MAG: nucleoside triphosphate pyrophosphohydrolase [Bacteroidota bacterium]
MTSNVPLIPPAEGLSYALNDPTLAGFERLRRIMDQLRENCPWDKKQTFESLRSLTIEEVYELSDAIADQDWVGVGGEMGDLFLHLLFYARLGREDGTLDLDDVFNAMCEKLIRRHPHLYAEVQADTPEQVKANWEKIKLQEGRRSVLQGVPRSLPALVKAMRIQEKAAGVGFDFPNLEGVLAKIREELDELLAAEQPEHRAEEWGDLMFALVNAARFAGIPAENALEAANRKFIRRIEAIEKEAHDQGLAITDLSMDAMQAAWDKAKAAEKNFGV